MAFGVRRAIFTELSRVIAFDLVVHSLHITAAGLQLKICASRTAAAVVLQQDKRSMAERSLVGAVHKTRELLHTSHVKH